jgi:hypothetical protein
VNGAIIQFKLMLQIPECALTFVYNDVPLYLVTAKLLGCIDTYPKKTEVRLKATKLELHDMSIAASRHGQLIGKIDNCVQKAQLDVHVVSDTQLLVQLRL